MNIVLFCVLAALGAGIRLGLSGFKFNSFELGTLLANVIGAFLIGLVASGVMDKQLDVIPKLLVSVAFIGALTTFSSYTLEVTRYLMERNWQLMLFCIFSHNLLSISACYVGMNIFSGSPSLIE